ncbi:hypothetical protein ACFVY0_40425 [Streptomyces sp. NPDC058286]|uniref:hypothetical protein n=1 Tax=Streptomyces sp. NPDC058286 TaxID=3346422 RepID=UPI0036E2A319
MDRTDLKTQFEQAREGHDIAKHAAEEAAERLAETLSHAATFASAFAAPRGTVPSERCAMTDTVTPSAAVYGPGDYWWDIAAQFPATNAGLGGPWPRTGSIAAHGHTVLTEPTADTDLREQLLDELAGPELEGRDVTVTRFVITPAA